MTTTITATTSDLRVLSIDELECIAGAAPKDEQRIISQTLAFASAAGTALGQTTMGRVVAAFTVGYTVGSHLENNYHAGEYIGGKLYEAQEFLGGVGRGIGGWLYDKTH